VAVAGLALAGLVPDPIRSDVALGALVGVALQAPLGWWALRSLGSDRFMLIFGLGILLRLTVVLVAGVTLQAALARSVGPALVTMVGILVALLLVEGAAAMGQQSGEPEKR
jgi:heme A synthase